MLKSAEHKTIYRQGHKQHSEILFWDRLSVVTAGWRLGDWQSLHHFSRKRADAPGWRGRIGRMEIM